MQASDEEGDGGEKEEGSLDPHEAAREVMEAFERLVGAAYELVADGRAMEADALLAEGERSLLPPPTLLPSVGPQPDPAP